MHSPSPYGYRARMRSYPHVSSRQHRMESSLWRSRRNRWCSAESLDIQGCAWGWPSFCLLPDRHAGHKRSQSMKRGSGTSAKDTMRWPFTKDERHAERRNAMPSTRHQVLTACRNAPGRRSAVSARTGHRTRAYRVATATDTTCRQHSARLQVLAGRHLRRISHKDQRCQWPFHACAACGPPMRFHAASPLLPTQGVCHAKPHRKDQAIHP